MTMDPEADRLVGVAARLFAELGFDGTSMRLIADAAGVDVEWLTTRAGGKHQLYAEVMLRAHRAEREVLDAAVAAFTPAREGLIELADAYLDFYAAHPQILALWLHRWMGDAADVPDLEDLYSRPLSALLLNAVRDLIPADIDAEHLLWTVVWCVYGFLAGGMRYVDPHRRQGRRGRPPSTEELEDFRAYLHAMIIHMTTPVSGSAR
jgi:AcrR family transcriptional regulator